MTVIKVIIIPFTKISRVRHCKIIGREIFWVYQNMWNISRNFRYFEMSFTEISITHKIKCRNQYELLANIDDLTFWNSGWFAELCCVAWHVQFCFIILPISESVPGHWTKLLAKAFKWTFPKCAAYNIAKKIWWPLSVRSA